MTIEHQKVETVEFTFDPYNSTNPEIKAVFQDELAQIIWVAIKRNHLVDQYFNKNCLGLAKTLRLKQFKNINGKELNILLRNRGMLGSEEHDVGDKILPYIKKERIFQYAIKTKEVAHSSTG